MGILVKFTFNEVLKLAKFGISIRNYENAVYALMKKNTAKLFLLLKVTLWADITIKLLLTFIWPF